MTGRTGRLAIMHREDAPGRHGGGMGRGGDRGRADGRRRLTGLALVAGVILVLGVAGCSSGSRGSTSTSGGNVAPGFDAGAKANQDAAAGSGQLQSVPGAGPAAKPGAVLNPAQVPDNQQRDIVYTGGITVRVSNVDDAANRLTVLTTGAGGYVSADARSIDAGRSSATIAVRIPAAKFSDTVDAIGRLGTELNRQLSADDVTGQLIDLDSRLKTQQASVDRVRALLARAQTIADIVSLESELTRREADLESLQAQQAALSGQAALSTITVTLLGPDAVAAKPKKTNGFLHGLSTGWHAFTVSLNLLGTALGALLPFVLIIGVPGWLVFRLRRRSRRSHPSRSSADSGSSPPSS